MIDRAAYAGRFGPTVGDRVRLADTDLYATVEVDHVGYGDEPLFGFGKTLRSRLLQDDRAARDSEVDFVVLGVLLIDPLVGVAKTNIGIKDGRVVGIGPINGPAHLGQDLSVGPNTYPISAYGLIATPGGVDSHVHLPTPRIVPAALSAGVTTLITAGFEEPPFGMHRMLRGFEFAPVNIGLQACARTARPESSEEIIAAGAVGLKVHEDYGAYPAVIDAALRSADAHDVAVCLHTDGLNESAEIDDTLAAIDHRTIHAYHVEGSAGGHLPDNLMLVTDASVICSSTTPSFPYARYTAAEHIDMILAVHGGDPDLPDDVLAVRERVHETTMAAEGPLHDLGAISITNSDSQGVGRIAETVRRTWQLADAMKRWRAGQGSRWTEHSLGSAPEAADDNARIMHYLAKYTIEPAIVHGISHEVGTLMPGHLADLVLWRPGLFGVKPEMVLKNGFEAWGAMGDGNGSVERIQPVAYGGHWGTMGTAGAAVGTTFVSQAALEHGLGDLLGTRRRLCAVHRTRNLTRDDLVANRSVPPIEVDPRNGEVFLDGERLAADPVSTVPLNRTYLVN